MVYVMLCEGFEEIEAVSVVDVLRRAGIEVQTAGISGKRVTGSHGITVEADIEAGDMKKEGLSMIVLPGGPGAGNLNCETVSDMLRHAAVSGAYIAAICAAPKVLAKNGLLRNVRAVCYPGCEKDLDGAVYLPHESVAKDGGIITGKAPGTAIEFALKLVEVLAGFKTMEKIKKDLCCHADARELT